MRGLKAILLSATFAACSSAGADEPPTLEILTPERGTTADTHDITVTGKTSASKVTINGVDAIIQNDGTFSATLTVDDGITLIETHAVRGSADIRDVRAVMAGSLSPTDGSIGGPIAARVGSDGFVKVGAALAATAQALDWQALALGMNPIYDTSGCNSAKIDIQELRVGTIGVGLTPAAGAIDTAVTIDDVFVKMKVNFRAVCISGSTTATVRSSRAHINGDLALAAAAGKLTAALPSSSVQLDGFSLDVSGVPGAIESLIKGEVRKAAEKALNNVVKQQVPPKASEALGGLLAQPLNANILDKATTFTITPSSVDIDADGLVATVDAKVRVAGGEGGMFVSTPMPIDSMQWQGNDLGLALADDVVNQLFSGLWATGAITPTISLDGPAGILGAVLDSNARSLKIDMMLPPVVRAQDGVLDLAIGDLILSARDESGVEVQSFALSLTTTLAASPGASGAIAVTLGTPVVRAQPLKLSEDSDTSGEQLEGLVNGAWGLVGSMIGDAMGTLPLPAIAGISMGGPSVTGQRGFLVVDVPIGQ
ncbi:MAG: hypothetical protein H0V17_08150 [Deltaproteobacteria bacterium]|nr:hypothetical protein [Deltaproteobacteria bacterium]